MKDHNETSTMKSPPTPMDILSGTIQTLADKNSALYSIVNRVHEKFFGEYVFTPEEANEETLDTPGAIASLTRELELVISTIQNTIQVAESIDNQA